MLLRGRVTAALNNLQWPLMCALWVSRCTGCIRAEITELGLCQPHHVSLNECWLARRHVESSAPVPWCWHPALCQHWDRQSQAVGIPKVAPSAACAVTAGDASDSCPIGVCGHSSGATGCNGASQGGPTPGVNRCQQVQTRWCWQSQSQMWTSRSGDSVSGKGVFLTRWEEKRKKKKERDPKVNFPF